MIAPDVHGTSDLTRCISSFVDANKLKVLRDVDYKIGPSCALCKHGEFRTIKDDFGSCLAKTYEHLKHTGEPRQLSVYRGGSCRDFVQSPEKLAALGAYGEFRPV